MEALFGAESRARQAVHRVQMQVLQRVGSRAQAVQALEERRAMAHEEQSAKVQQVQKRVLQQARARTQAARAVEEEKALAHNVQKQVLQQVRARAQSVRAVEEGRGAARRQQASQEGEKATLQEKDRSPNAALHRLHRQVLQRVGSRARTAQAVEEQRALAHNVQKRVLQQVRARAQERQAAEGKGSQMGELFGMKGDNPEMEQGLGVEAVMRWLDGAQGEGTVAPAIEMPGPAVVNSDEGALPQYKTNTLADDSGPETTEESQLGDRSEVKYFNAPRDTDVPV